MISEKVTEEERKLLEDMNLYGICDFKVNMMLHRTMLMRELSYIMNKDLKDNDLLLTVQIQQQIDNMQSRMDLIDNRIKWQNKI